MGRVKRAQPKSAVDSIIYRKKRLLTAPRNPFNQVSAAPKRHIVLGRKIKGADRDCTAARTKAINTRLQSLQDEFNRHHNNKFGRFIDNRFGENNPALSSDAKREMKFEHERRKGKLSYSLEDDLGDNEEITHHGAALSSVLEDEYQERLDQERDQDEMERDRQLMMIEAGRSGEARTRREILDDVIRRSKAAKAESTLAKEEDALLLEQMDAEWADMRMDLDYSRPEPAAEELDDDDFEIIARQLSTQAAPAASNRSLTESEEAQQAKEKLEELEKQRLKRMTMPKKQTPGRHSIEDLNATNVVIDPEFVLEETDVEEDDDDQEYNLSDDEDENVVIAESSAVAGNDDEIPFVIAVPDHVQELIDLSRFCPERLATIIERIRAGNHILLHADNSIALQRLLRMLIQFLRHCWSDQCAITSATVSISDVLVASIGSLANQFPRLASDLIQQRILSKVSSSLSSLSELPISVLIEAQAAISIFLSSDYAHACITSCVLALMAYISALNHQGRLMTCSSRTVLLLDIVLQYVGHSGKFCPELVVHLQICLGNVLDRAAQDGASATAPAIPLTDLSETGFAVDPSIIISLIQRTATLYRQLPSFPEFIALVDVANSLIVVLANCRCSSTLRSSSEFLSEMISDAIRVRSPLMAERPIPKIRERDPIIYDDFVPGQDRDPDEEKKNQRILKRKMQCEKKGARRELRRDAQFVESERRAMSEKQKERHDVKRKEIRTFMQRQAKDTNALRVSKRRK